MESNRIIFYPLGIQHLPDISSFLANHEVRYRMKLPTLDTEAKRHDWFEAFQVARNSRTAFRWAGYLKSNKQYASLLTIKDIDHTNSRAELGYSVNPALWGHGLASEAAGLGCDFAFNKLGIHTLIAKILPDNPASLRIIQKLGFVQEAHFKESHFFEDDYHDLLQFYKINPAHLAS